ncbi:DUF6870 family protein [Scatolibacter rhodanostii]|uniref:DUF6870 family protein n=1 Tax=Scatolibacter rhodanostii TaxID=2014781 RepID=UPI000C06CB30|nr:hypothetical protein [Scatolibacter rhodanostii]
MMITSSELEIMSQQNIETINRKELVDLSAIHIRQDLPHEEKILDFLERIKNPYCFLCGDIPVRVCFTDNGPKLSKTLENYFIRIKQG